jgi:hypothetical protein
MHASWGRAGCRYRIVTLISARGPAPAPRFVGPLNLFCPVCRGRCSLVGELAPRSAIRGEAPFDPLGLRIEVSRRAQPALPDHRIFGPLGEISLPGGQFPQLVWLFVVRSITPLQALWLRANADRG